MASQISPRSNERLGQAKYNRGAEERERRSGRSSASSGPKRIPFSPYLGVMPMRTIRSRSGQVSRWSVPIRRRTTARPAAPRSGVDAGRCEVATTFEMSGRHAKREAGFGAEDKPREARVLVCCFFCPSSALSSTRRCNMMVRCLKTLETCPRMSCDAALSGVALDGTRDISHTAHSHSDISHPYYSFAKQTLSLPSLGS